MKKKSRKPLWILGALVILGGLGVTGFVVMSRPTTEIDSSRLATVERGDIARSVVATGRIEPITKVEIKSKANGIIEGLKVQVGDDVAHLNLQPFDDAVGLRFDFDLCDRLDAARGDDRARDVAAFDRGQSRRVNFGRRARHYDKARHTQAAEDDKRAQYPQWFARFLLHYFDSVSF